jgi:hypothetical protein
MFSGTDRRFSSSSCESGSGDDGNERRNSSEQIRQLEEALRDYEALKSGELTLPNVERLDHDRALCREMRIANGVSQN